MKRWYAFYSEDVANRHQTGDELEKENRQPSSVCENTIHCL